MAVNTLNDEQIKEIITCYLANGRNINQTARTTGYAHHSVRRYAQMYDAGKLAHLGLPDPGIDPASVAPTEHARTLALRRELAALRQERADLLKEKEEREKLLRMFSFVREANITPPTWTAKKPQAGGRAAIPTAFLSDVHLDEVVRPEQVNFVNAFDRTIAEQRIELFFNHTIELARDYLQGLTYEGLVMPLGGDIFSGIIHEELVETNAATIFESLLYWCDPIAAGIRLMRDAFGRVFVPCVVGNHGRRQRKPHAKNRAQDNFDYFFYHLLRKTLAAEKHIEFAISDSADQPYLVFDTRYLLTHGDQFRGGSGIAGMLSPLLLGDSRQRERENAVRRPYDYLVMGHWHQLAFLRGLIVNGSVKGYDEYAFISNFRFEPPRQAFWVTDIRHGVTLTAPIHVTAETEEYSAGTGEQAVVGMGRAAG